MTRSLFLALFLTLLLGISTAWAAIINVPGDQPTIREAIDAAGNGDTIILQANFEIIPADYMHTNYALMISNKSIVFDLNGHNISSSADATIYISTSGTLTLKDTSGNGDGTVINNSPDQLHAVGNFGNFTMESGNLNATYYGLYNYYYSATMFGTATISGGTIYGGYGGLGNCGDLTVSGGSISGQDYDIDSSGKLTITQDITLNSVKLRNGSDAPEVPDTGTLVLAPGVDILGSDSANSITIEAGATMDVPAGNNLGLANGVTTQAYELLWSPSLNMWRGPVTNITQALNYNTIQAAVDAANSGDEIQVANGNYTISATLLIDKSLSIIGESESGVIIDATTFTGHAIQIKASNVTLQNFTVQPNPASNSPYCIKADPASPATPPTIYANLTLDHITINGAYRTPFNVNGYNIVTLSNLNATNTAYGVGVGIAGCDGVTLSGITTSGNSWGGVAIYVSPWVNRGSNNVTFDFANSNVADGIYYEDELGYTNTNISILNYTHGINGSHTKHDQPYNIKFYIAGTLADALNLGAGFNVKHENMASYVWANAAPIENYYVGPGMAIQAAIDVATPGDVIEVQPGTYVEQLHITTENLTIRGVGAEPVVIQSPAVLPLTFGISAVNRPIVFVDGVSNFTLTDVTVDGNCLGNANNRFYGVAFWDAGGTLEDVHITNIMENPFSGEQHGIGVYAYNSTPLENYTINMNRVLIDNFQKNGVHLVGDSGSLNLTVNMDYVTIIGEGRTGVIAQNGIQFNYCTGTVDNCNLSGFYYTGSDWNSAGVIVIDCVDMVLTGNTVTDSDIAIYSHGGTGIEYISNQVSGDCNFGIFDHPSWPSTGLVANQNTITGITYAIWLSPGAAITNNILTGNEYAIVLSDDTGYTVTGNQLTDNYVHVYNFGAEPDVNTLIPTNTYAPTYFIVDQTIYGNGAVLYVDAPLEVIQDNVQQTYSVITSYAGNLRGFTVKLVIPKADFATEPTNFVKGSAFTSPLYVDDQSTDTEWIYVVTGSVLGASSVTGENVTFFTFDATSTEDYNNVPDGCYIQLPWGDVILRDEHNQPIECFDILDKWILIDNIAPTPVVWEDEITALLHPCRTTPDANNSIDLMWTNPEDAKKIQIWTLSYGNAGDGYTHYPEYEDHNEPILTAPDPLLGSPQNGWVKAAEIDPPDTFPYTLTGMDRGYYYITLFAVDEVGNISDAPEAPFHRESISYWPGDVNGDGEVKDDDLSSLGAVWGLTSSSDAWNNLIDIGPSTDYARRSRPTPDGKIDIEDLMMLAMNYYNTHYTDYHRNSPELNPVTVTMATQSSGNQVFVNLELSGNNGFLKGLNMPIAYGSGLQLASVEQGNIWPETSLLLHTNAEGLVEVSCVTLGRNALEGDGNVATLVFNVVGDDTEITPQPMIARSLDNHEITVTYDCTANDDLVNVIPLESYLGSNYPNPFNPSTTIQYGLKEAGSVRINVYNSRGQLVRTLVDENKAAGTYRVVWDGKDGKNRSVSSGIYYFRMEAKGCMKTNKGILIK